MPKNDHSIKTKHEKILNNKETKFYLKKTFSNYFWKFVDIIACKIRKVAETYEKAIGNQYKKEYKVFGILKYNKALHVGCGAYPLTEITLAKLPGKKIIGIDKNLKAVLSARKIIKKKDLDKKISIENENGLNYSVKGFDVIIVSSCSTPKEKILDNIFKNANENSIIIVREINSGTNNILEYINKQNEVKLVNKVQFRTLFPIPFSWNSICLIKKRES